MTQQDAAGPSLPGEQVTPEDRQRLKGHAGAVVWFTGLPASGKTTLAGAVDALLTARGCHAYVLDSDTVRRGLSKDLGFTPEDRHENIRRIGEVASLLANAGLLAVVAFISPYAEDRRRAREINPPGRFFETYCCCPLKVCEQRDPKGLYRAARAGLLRDFTGIDAPYEPPKNPELVLNTDRETVEQCANRVLTLLQERNIIPRSGQ